MTPEEHNKYLGWAHLAHGGLYALIFLLTVAMIAASFAFSGGMNDPLTVGMLAFSGVLMLCVMGIYSVPSLVAGYGLLKRKSWARKWGIVAGVMAALQFPLGTALCVYSLWFLLGERGKKLYAGAQERFSQQASGQPRGSLYEPVPDEWNASRTRERERAYAPPTEMPNWRGED